MAIKTPDGVFSDKEIEALQILANDCSARFAADVLGITKEAVDGRLRAARRRFGMKTTYGLLAEAMRMGVVG